MNRPWLVGERFDLEAHAATLFLHGGLLLHGATCISHEIDSDARRQQSCLSPWAMLRRMILVVVTAVAGCGVGTVQDAHRITPYSLTENAFTLNLFVSNGLVGNGLRMNGLRMNGLRMNGLTVDTLSINDRPQDESLWILGYLVSCALPAGHSLSLTVGVTSYTLEGGLGLAPALEFDTLDDPDDQERVSACMMARTNWRSTFQAPHAVAISLRGNHPSLVLPDDGFIYLDSGFFGNLFTSPASLFTCNTSNMDYSFIGYLLGRGRAAGLVTSNFPGFAWGGSPDTAAPANCWGMTTGAAISTGACDGVYNGYRTIPDSDAANAGARAYDDAILASCAGGGRTWSHPIFVTLDSLTD
jgi:hypothetical protein